MEASETGLAPTSAAEVASTQFDVTGIHGLLDQAEQAYHDLFDGHVPGEVARFTPKLDTVRMIVDLSAQEAPKEED